MVRYTTAGLSDEEAFERWRALMAPRFDVEPLPGAAHWPRGDISSFVFGDVVASKILYSPQRTTRRKSLAGSTPDHLTLRLYQRGGFAGEIATAPALLKRGMVVIADMRHTLDTRMLFSDTIGVAIPHRLLPGLDRYRDRPAPVLEARRNRLLAAWITALHRDLPFMDQADAPAVCSDLIEFLYRLFDPSTARDALEGLPLDQGVRVLAQRVIALHLGSASLSPDVIAERLGIARATLYRAFQHVGIMTYIQACRLDAVRAALGDPFERRSLTQLAVDHGFSSLTMLGRSYRARFGMTPRDARALGSQSSLDQLPTNGGQARAWLYQIGS